MHTSILIIFGANAWYFHVFQNPHYNALVNMVVVILPVVLAVSALSYYAIEKPLLELRGKYTSNRV